MVSLYFVVGPSLLDGTAPGWWTHRRAGTASGAKLTIYLCPCLPSLVLHVCKKKHVEGADVPLDTKQRKQRRLQQCETSDEEVLLEFAGRLKASAGFTPEGRVVKSLTNQPRERPRADQLGPLDGMVATRLLHVKLARENM